MLHFDDDKLKKDLQGLQDKEEEELVEMAAVRKNMPYVNLVNMVVSTDALALMEEEDAREAGMALFKLTSHDLHAAMLSPENTHTRAQVRALTDAGYVITQYLASHRSLDKAWGRYEDLRLTNASAGSFVDISDAALQQIAEVVHLISDVKALFEEIADEEENKRTSRLMEIIMGGAIALGVSDVHVEPQNDMVRLRYRLDGILEDVLLFDFNTYKAILNRIKILAGMKLNVTSGAQDGRFTIEYNKVEIEIRVSNAPGAYGEGVVMRILDPSNINVGLGDLGIEPFLMEKLKAEIDKPNGLILNTGPTGSGKTTTLYSLLKYVYNPEIKVLTIEDPIEYHLDGVHQTPVDHSKGYDFEAGLRAAMRQDPDVILVGEIRDHETALSAMQAAQTGHLVLSTLHTNSAAGALPRLLDLDINFATLAQSLTVALAQRLVRKLTDAKKKVKPTPGQEKIMRGVLRHAEISGKDLSRFGISSDMDMWMYEPVPSEKSASGYKGRLGIFEAIFVDETIKDLLDKKPTDRQVKKAAQHQNILTLAEDAVVKILLGMTSYEEVMRVVDLTEDVFLESEEEGMAEIVGQVGNGAAALSAGQAKNGAAAPLAPTAYHPDSMIRSSSVRDSVMPKDLPSHEVGLLVDYLRMLENHQESYPETSVEEKVQDVERTLIELLKHHQPNDLFLQRHNEKKIEHEIDSLLSQLQTLKAHQKINPTAGVANQLSSIRGAIEEMMHG